MIDNLFINTIRKYLMAIKNSSSSKEIKSKKNTKKDKQINPKLIKEVGGGEGPEPTRYGDWEKNGRCTDF